MDLHPIYREGGGRFLVISCYRNWDISSCLMGHLTHIYRLHFYHYLIAGSRVQNKNNSLQFAKNKGTGAKAGTSAHQQVIDGIRSQIILKVLPFLTKYMRGARKYPNPPQKEILRNSTDSDSPRDQNEL